jgi:hypothetical protein
VAISPSHTVRWITLNNFWSFPVHSPYFNSKIENDIWTRTYIILHIYFGAKITAYILSSRQCSGIISFPAGLMEPSHVLNLILIVHWAKKLTHSLHPSFEKIFWVSIFQMFFWKHLLMCKRILMNQNYENIMTFYETKYTSYMIFILF